MKCPKRQTKKYAELTKTVWVIMTKDRKQIVKGNNKELARVDNSKDRKRFLIFNSKKSAETGMLSVPIGHLPGFPERGQNETSCFYDLYLFNPFHFIFSSGNTYS